MNAEGRVFSHIIAEKSDLPHKTEDEHTLLADDHIGIPHELKIPKAQTIPALAIPIVEWRQTMEDIENIAPETNWIKDATIAFFTFSLTIAIDNVAMPLTINQNPAPAYIVISTATFCLAIASLGMHISIRRQARTAKERLLRIMNSKIEQHE